MCSNWRFERYDTQRDSSLTVFGNSSGAFPLGLDITVMLGHPATAACHTLKRGVSVRGR